MGKFQKGQSGNPEGRPKGSGKNQIRQKQLAHESAMLARLNLVLAEIDTWHERRLKIINDYALCRELFPLDPDNTAQLDIKDDYSTHSPDR